MAEISNKLNFLESENKLLMDQQHNYKELCKILTQRHIEILKYLSNLKNLIEKLIPTIKDNNNLLLTSNYYQDKSIYEANILKYDKQIQYITDSIQSSYTRISDNEGNQFKEHLKLLSTSLVDLSIKNPNVLQHIETNIHNPQQQQAPQQQHTVLVYHGGDYSNSQEILAHDYFKKDINVNEVKMNEDGTLYVPKIVLEDLELNANNNNNNNNQAYPILANNNTVAIITAAPQAASNILTNNSNPNTTINTTNSNDNIKNIPKLALCEYCGKYFNKHYLASHKRSHTGARPYKCSIFGCNRTFTQTSSRNVHEKRVHNVQHGKLEFKCTYCDANFDNMNDMQKHAQQHQAILNTMVTQQQQQFEQIHVNSVPNLKFINPNPNHNVVQIATTAPPVAKRARKSGQNAATNGPINTSQQSNHNGHGRHVCPHCGKAFAYRVAMKQHMALHGQKNYRCTYNDCNYASYWKHNLALHINRHHQPTSGSSTSSTSLPTTRLATSSTVTAVTATAPATPSTASSAINNQRN